MANPRICTWEDLSLADTEKLLQSCSTLEAVQRGLRCVLGRADTDSKQDAIELDLYSYAVIFAHKNNFNAAQTSAFFSIVKSVHSLCVSTPFDNQEQVLELFNHLMVRHGVCRPPYCVPLFSLAQVKTITHYVLRTYFKHFKMYKYAFTKRVRLDVTVGCEEELSSPDEVHVDRATVEEVVAEGDEEVITEGDEEPIEIETTSEPAPQPITPVPKKESELEEIVSSCLSQKLRGLQLTVEQEMAGHEKKLSQRIDDVERIIATGKGSKPRKTN